MFGKRSLFILSIILFLTLISCSNPFSDTSLYSIKHYWISYSTYDYLKTNKPYAETAYSYVVSRSGTSLIESRTRSTLRSFKQFLKSKNFLNNVVDEYVGMLYGSGGIGIWYETISNDYCFICAFRE